MRSAREQIERDFPRWPHLDTNDRVRLVVMLKTELERAERALRFYADERNWNEQPTAEAERGHYPTHVPACSDGGALARKSLGEQTNAR